MSETPRLADVVIVGAGPAGAVAATVLARAGARVRLLDRATFPREKLCGDTVNPGTLAMLRRLKMAEAIDERGVRVDGMVVTGSGGVSVTGTYPAGLHGRSLCRADLDWSLVQHAIAAGAEFEPGVTVHRALVSSSRRQVEGVAVGMAGAIRDLRAPVTIAADGRRSVLAFGLGLAAHPTRPRRWAVGAYFTDVLPNPVNPVNSVNPVNLVYGEMHIRSGRYIGVAPVAGDRTNVCFVKPSGAGDADFRDPAAFIRRELAHEPLLADRFRGARLVAPPAVLGPLAVEAVGRSIDGLLLAGDAAGFVDPMTGDGLRFAVRGGELAAIAALSALEHGWPDVHTGHHAARRREFSGKYRFNRVLRGFVASPAAVASGATVASFLPGIVRRLVAHAGDCGLA